MQDLSDFFCLSLPGLVNNKFGKSGCDQNFF